MPWWSCHQNHFFFHFMKGGSCTSSYEGLRAPCLIFGTYPPMPVFRGKQAACRAGVSHTCVRSYVRALYAVNTCKKVYERQLRRCTRVVHKVFLLLLHRIPKFVTFGIRPNNFRSLEMDVEASNQVVIFGFRIVRFLRFLKNFRFCPWRPL